jgi:hypothetical protein
MVGLSAYLNIGNKELGKFCFEVYVVNCFIYNNIIESRDLQNGHGHGHGHAWPWPWLIFRNLRDRDRDRDQIARDYDRDRDQRLGLQIINRLYWTSTN